MPQSPAEKLRRTILRIAALGVLLLAASCAAPEQQATLNDGVAQDENAPAFGVLLRGGQDADVTPPVAATADAILALRDAPATAPAWKIVFAGSGQNAKRGNDLTVILSSADFGVVEQAALPGSTALIDYRLGRVFYLEPSSSTFWSTSIATEPYFRIHEWEHRLSLMKLVESAGGKADTPALTSDFWRSHELGIRNPRRPAPAVIVEESVGGLSLVQDGQEVISLTASRDDLPPTIAAQLWQVLLRVHPIHPDFVQKATEKGLVPARISFLRPVPAAAPQRVDLRLRSIEKIDYGYPLTADFTPEAPPVQYNPRAAWLVAVAWNAAQGDFPLGEPDTGYWRAHFENALRRGSELELFLTYTALGLYTGSQEPGCDGAAALDPAVLCPYVRQATDRNRYSRDFGARVALIGASDRQSQLEAVALLPAYREEAGDMAPLIDLFVANHISALTKVVTRGSTGLPDRDEAVDYYLSALKTFPFIRQIYGDIATYYFEYFDMHMGFFFADVGRSLPVPGQVRPGSNLANVGNIEHTLRADFPAYF